MRLDLEVSGQRIDLEIAVTVKVVFKEEIKPVSCKSDESILE
jgi:hypothetical protein